MFLNFLNDYWLFINVLSRLLYFSLWVFRFTLALWTRLYLFDIDLPCSLFNIFHRYWLTFLIQFHLFFLFIYSCFVLYNDFFSCLSLCFFCFWSIFLLNQRYSRFSSFLLLLFFFLNFVWNVFRTLLLRFRNKFLFGLLLDLWFFLYCFLFRFITLLFLCATHWLLFFWMLRFMFDILFLLWLSHSCLLFII